MSRKTLAVFCIAVFALALVAQTTQYFSTIFFGSGSTSNPSVSFRVEQNTGLYRSGLGNIGITFGGTTAFVANGANFNGGSGQVFGWASVSNPAAGVADTGISRCGVGIACFGNGTAGDFSGAIQSHTVNLSGRTSGITTLAAAATATGTLTFPAITDTLSTTTLTESPKNKTFNSASSGNHVNLLNETGPNGSFTGNSADQVVFTYTLPANTLAAGTGIEIIAVANHIVGSAAITWKVNFGGTAWTVVPITDTSVKAERFECLIFNNSGVTNAQHGSVAVDENSGATRIIGSTSTAAVATSSDVTITLTFNVANTDQVAGQQFLVKLVQ